MMRLTTPLGPDVLLLTALHGREALSRLFSFQLELLATNETVVPFKKLVGQAVTVELLLPGSKARYFNGVVRRMSKGRRDQTFTHYRAEVVPQFWLLTKKVRARIFQHMSVPDILRTVLSSLNTEFRLQGNFHPREYCVQYRESDFAFASRLMEEEGIFYYFEHSNGAHKMVLGNHPQAHSKVVSFPEVKFDNDNGGLRDEMRVLSWEETQELRSSKVTLWDYNFEMPYQHLEADRQIQDQAQVGQETLDMALPPNNGLEIYDFPGDYSYHFDGVDRGGAERPADLQGIFEENVRYARVRMEEEAARGIQVEGKSTCRQFNSGQKFQLKDHFAGDGEYILTSVEHVANLGENYRTNSSSNGKLQYENRYVAIPSSLPYRPERVTPRPVIHGTQSAVVVGPPGEEIYCDKYGRVKVQFLWDREGKWDAESSCWVRTTNGTSDNSARMVHVPRIDSEVIVGFEEGDPDRPIIVGTVFNSKHMPTWQLPDFRDWHGFSISRYPGNVATDLPSDPTQGKSSMQRIDSSNGNEKWHENAPHDHYRNSGHNQTRDVANNHHESIGNSFLQNVTNDVVQLIGYPATSPGVDGNNQYQGGGLGSLFQVVKNHLGTTVEQGDHHTNVQNGSTQNTSAGSYSVYNGGNYNVRTSGVGSMVFGKTFSLQAVERMVFQCGKSAIELLPNGVINVVGSQVINLNTEPNGDPTVPDSPSSVVAQAMNLATQQGLGKATTQPDNLANILP
jgi:type VI secretion system secreted protein VgrG